MLSLYVILIIIYDKLKLVVLHGCFTTEAKAQAELVAEQLGGAMEEAEHLAAVEAAAMAEALKAVTE